MYKRNNIKEYSEMKSLDFLTKQLSHFLQNTKMAEFLMMTSTPQLRKIAIIKKASHSSSIREPDIDFRNQVATL